MRTQSSDTSPAAEAVYIALLRQRTPAQRLAMVALWAIASGRSANCCSIAADGFSHASEELRGRSAFST